MWQKLLSLFRSAKPRAPDTFPAPAAPDAPAEPAGDEPARSMAADDPRNPFGIPGYDCLAFTQSMISTTRDQAIVEKFLSSRTSAGQDLIGSLPQDPVEMACQLTYPYTGEVADGVLFKSSRMEEKWDIYLYRNRTYFCRSWTGMLVYVAETGFSEGKVVLSTVHAAAEAMDDGGRYALQQVDYLLKSHLFDVVAPHPLPATGPATAEEIAVFSFSQYGRKCCFATYEETIAVVRAPVKA